MVFNSIDDFINKVSTIEDAVKIFSNSKKIKNTRHMLFMWPDVIAKNLNNKKSAWANEYEINLFFTKFLKAKNIEHGIMMIIYDLNPAPATTFPVYKNGNEWFLININQYDEKHWNQSYFGIQRIGDHLNNCYVWYTFAFIPFGSMGEIRIKMIEKEDLVIYDTLYNKKVYIDNITKDNYIKIKNELSKSLINMY